MSIKSVTDRPGPSRRRWVLGIIALLALAMGLPTLGGGFVGGDDHRLLLDHVLVNHPSWSHAVQLFTTFHRDLYQPVPLLSFQAEFAIAQWLGLFESGAEGGAWLFHLTNMLLHAVNAVLVWLVIARLHARLTQRMMLSGDVLSQAASSGGDRAVFLVATITAMIFAVHPLQVEVVAWANGRMMLLSTLFAMLSLLTFDSFLDRPRWKEALLTLVFVLLCSLSKVRVGLPILLLVVFLARRSRIERRAVILWVACGLVAALFAWINIAATAEVELFSEGAAYLRGPRLARVFMALACYFQHLVWPVGLASYYPTPPIVQWADGQVLWATVVAVAGLVGLAILCRRHMVARLGVLWFFSTLAATLPIVPARNILAADRYMYLPISGMVWMLVAVGYGASRRFLVGARCQRILIVVGVGMLVVCVGMCWHVARFYSTPLAKTQRISSLFPDTPRVWEPLGWTYYSEGDYAEARRCAQMELRHESSSVRSGAYQLLGMCALKEGEFPLALEHLHRAIELNPKNPRAYYRLGLALDEMGRLADAVPYFERAVAITPKHNIRRNRLAASYLRMGRSEDARAIYEGSLDCNRYDVTAAMALAELDMARGTREGFEAARGRLEALVEWMPENTKAQTNLGAVLVALENRQAAEAIYREVLARDPGNVTAAINLGQLYHAAGDPNRAGPLFAQAMAIGPNALAEAKAIYDFFTAVGATPQAIEVWEAFVGRFPQVGEAHAYLLWAYARAGRIDRASGEMEALAEADRHRPIAVAAQVMLDMFDARYDQAVARVETLCDAGRTGDDARQRLLGALEFFDRQRPSVPWTFCLTARLLVANVRPEPAAVFTGLCEQHCAKDAVCLAEVARLRGLALDPDTGP